MSEQIVAPGDVVRVSMIRNSGLADDYDQNPFISLPSSYGTPFAMVGNPSPYEGLGWIWNVTFAELSSGEAPPDGMELVERSILATKYNGAEPGRSDFSTARRWALLDVVAIKRFFFIEEARSQLNEWGIGETCYREMNESQFGIVFGPLSGAGMTFCGTKVKVGRNAIVNGEDVSWVENSPLCKYGYSRDRWIV